MKSIETASSQASPPESDTRRLVVLGAGFGGINVAKALRDTGIIVTLVDRHNYHLFQPLLYQVATASLSPADIASPIRAIFRNQDNVRTILAHAQAIDVERRLVRLENGETIEYDDLIIATGAETSYFGHDYWASFAPGLKDLDDAERIRSAIFRSFEDAERDGIEQKRVRPVSIVVVGGGPTGVELAGAIGEIAHSTLPDDFHFVDPNMTRIILVDAGARVLSDFTPKLSRSAHRDLDHLGVEIRSNTRVTNVQPGCVMLGDERIDADLVVWAAGVRPSQIGTTLGADLDPIGRVIVEPDLSIPGHPEVFVIGDMAAARDNKGGFLPGVAQVAIQQGATAAENVLRRSRNQPTRPFHYRDKGMLATIGRGRAVALIRGVSLDAFVAWMIWAVVHIWSLIGFRNRLAVMSQWSWAYVTRQRAVRLITGDDLSQSPDDSLPNLAGRPALASFPGPEGGRRNA